MVNPNKTATIVDLRTFGIGLLLLGGLLLWWWEGHLAAQIVLGMGSVTATIALWAPERLRPLLKAWMMAVSPLAWTLSTFVLALVYYVVVTPIGLVKRVVSGSAISLGPNREMTTYWLEKETDVPTDNYFNQY